MTASELKASILDQAIRGRLTARWRDEVEVEESAVELLKRIKDQRIKSAKSKKTSAFSPITDDEKPFDIPEGWVWCRLGEVFRFIDYRGKTPTKITEGVPLVTAKNVRRGYVDYTVREFISETEFSSRQSRGVAKKGDILFTTEAPLGFAAIADLERFSTGQRLIALQDESGLLENRLLMYFLLSEVWQNEMKRQKTGTTVAGIKAERLKQILVPLPPLAEQKRIVAKIEELMPLVERYGKAETRRRELVAALPADLKKSILQEAIQGKLVSQDPNDEPASELLKRIAAERAKQATKGRGRTSAAPSPVTDDEKLFELPKSWMWCRLGDVIELVSGRDLEPNQYNDRGIGTVYITGPSCLSATGVLEKRWTPNPCVYAYLNDLLLVCKGAGYGKTVICDIQEAHIARQIMAIRSQQYVCLGYVKILLDFRIDEIKGRGQGLIPGIDRNAVLGLTLPLPPLAEQKRIVARVEELLGVVDTMENSIQSVRG